MLVIDIDDAVAVAMSVAEDRDEEYIRRAMEKRCRTVPEENTAAVTLRNMIADINPTEICEQIKSDNLGMWCVSIQIGMMTAEVGLLSQMKKEGK